MTATRLFKNFRIHQVYGANTSVGKTVVTTALVRASSSVYRHTFYLKPVSTGPDSEADDGYVWFGYFYDLSLMAHEAMS
jgi:bifunctional dethiobiotin synthetase / adenosylmethionine---8-amino-7-oxononanoate aminotransferase